MPRPSRTPTKPPSPKASSSKSSSSKAKTPSTSSGKAGPSARREETSRPSGSRTRDRVRRHATVRVTAHGKEINVPSALTLLDKDPFREPELFSQAPWFIPVLWKDKELINEYVTARDLPGRLPVRALSFPEWDLRFVVPDHAVLRQKDETHERARIELTRLLYKRLRRIHEGYPVGRDMAFDTWNFRSGGESRYGVYLSRLNASNWKGPVRATERALCFARPLLRADFRTTRKSHSYEFVEMIKWERKTRTRTGFLVPYQMVEIDRITHRARIGRYVKIPDWFGEVEVCRGMQVDLPPVLTYRGIELIDDPESGLWTVFYSEWLVKIAVFLLWEVYDQCRLWFLPTRVITDLRNMRIKDELGSEYNVVELKDYLDRIESTDWTQVPVSQALRGATRRVDHSPGRKADAGDFIYYSPWLDRVITAEEARAESRNPRQHPEGFKTGYVQTSYEETRDLYSTLRDSRPAEGASNSSPAHSASRSES